MAMTLLLLSLFLMAAPAIGMYRCFVDADTTCRRMKEAPTTSPTWSTRQANTVFRLLQVSLFLVLPLYIPYTNASTSHHETMLNSGIECLFSSPCTADCKSTKLPVFIKETISRTLESEEAVKPGSEGELGSLSLNFCVHNDIHVNTSSEFCHLSNLLNDYGSLTLTWSGFNSSSCYRVSPQETDLQSNSGGSKYELQMSHHAEYVHYKCFDKDTATSGANSSKRINPSMTMVHAGKLSKNLDKLQNSISFDNFLSDIAVICQNALQLQSKQPSEELQCDKISMKTSSLTLTEILIKSGIQELSVIVLPRDCNCSTICSYDHWELLEQVENRINLMYVVSGLKISAISNLDRQSSLASSKNKACKVSVSGYILDQMLCEGDLYLEELSRLSSRNSVLGTHKSDPFNKLQKLVGKVFLATLFYVLVMVLRILRQEGSVSADSGLWHSCSYTFSLQSSCPKAGLVRSTNNVHHLHDLNCKSWLPSTAVKTESSNNSNWNERFTGLIGSIFRWFFDYDTTTLKVRVQISESPSINVSPNVGFAGEDDMLINQESINIDSNDVSDCIDSSEIHQKSKETIEQGNMLHQSPASCTSPASLGEQDYSVTVKKDKSKRRKKKGNLNELRKDHDRGTRSGSSSPPSSPASPATPTFNRGNNPFTITRNDSYVSAVKGTALYTLSRNHMTRGTIHKGNLSTLDVHNVQFHREKNYQYSYNSLSPRMNGKTWGPKIPPTTVNRGGCVSDKVGSTVCGENWAAVARRAASCESDQVLKNGSSNKANKDGGHSKPVLLPSASFPQGGQRMRWSPRIFGEKLTSFGDPICDTPFTASSLVAPDARAPGSKLVKKCTGKLSSQDSVSGTMSERCDADDDRKTHNTGHEADDLLYDIWGNHFCQFSQTPGPLESSPLRNTPIPSPITAGFSIFSFDTIFPPQLEDNAPVPKPAIEH